MKIVIASALGMLLLAGCSAEKMADVPATETSATTATSTPPPSPATQTATATTATADPAIEASTDENQEPETWAGQISVGQPVSMFNYVGAESGDFAPMRFRNDSEAGKKILAACANGDMCEFTGIVQWLDEVPPADASAIGQIVRVDSVKRLPPE